MEDLKKIQEFFSKPLNENTFVEAFKLEKALKGMGYDVKVKYLDDFGSDVFEIYFQNPADADESIFYDAKKLGYDNVRVFANPQESLDENALGFNDSRLSSDQHRDLDYAVRGDSAYTFGNDPYADDQLRYKYAVKMGFLEEAKKLTYNDFVRMVRDDMMAGASPDERPSKELVAKRAKAYYNDYLQGASVDDLFEAKVEVDDETEFKLNLKHLLDKHVVEATKEEETEFHAKLDKLVHDTFGKRKGEMEEYNSGIYYDPAKSSPRPKAKEASKTAFEKVKDMLKKAMKEDLADFEEKEADYDKLYSNYLYKMVKEVATEKGYSKFLVSKDNPKGETSGLDTKTMNKILMNVIKDIDETIQLGKQLDEKKLCKAGEAYRKRRMAAGEKSSAYLSGRAVKVCKGQMSGKKKK